MKRVVASLAALAFAISSALAQVGPPIGPGNGGGGGGGGGGGPVTLNSVCPTGTQTGSTLTLNGQASFKVGDPVVGGAITVATTDCGLVRSFNLAGGTAITWPVSTTLPQGFVVTLANVGASGNGTVTAAAGGSINGSATLTILPNTSVTLYATDTNGIVLQSMNASASSATPGGSSGDYQKNVAGVFTGKTPGTGVDTAFGNTTNANGGLLTQNGAITSGNLLSESVSGPQDSGLPAATTPQTYTIATGGNGTWVPLWSTTYGQTGVAPAQNTARCAPFKRDLAEHWDGASIYVGVLGTGPITFSFYTDAIDATTHRHQPQSVITSGSWTVTGTGAATQALGVAGTGIAIPQGLSWICTNDATASDAVRTQNLATTNPVIATLVGSPSANGANSLNAAGGVTTGFTTAVASGTWNPLAGVSLTESVSAQTIGVTAHIVSSP